MKNIGCRVPRRLVTLGFAVLWLAPAAVRAAECPESSPEDPQERRKLAKEWFSTAETAENNGDDAEATRAYACSYKMVAHPFTAFNLARVAERSGDSELALKMFKAYIALKPDAKDKDEVKLRIKAIEDKLAANKGSGEAEPSPAAPTPEATPPESATSEAPAATEATPPPDVLTPPPEPKPAEVVQQVAPEPAPETAPPSHLAEWIVGGVTAAALVGGIVTNFVARAKMDTCRTDASNQNLADADAECNAARPMAYASYTLLSVAAVGAALDGVLIILHHRRGGADDSTSGDEEAMLGVAPLPNGGMLTARGRF
jgi:hypothetical protein